MGKKLFGAGNKSNPEKLANPPANITAVDGELIDFFKISIFNYKGLLHKLFYVSLYNS
jgi:hypothetical protein